MSRTVEHVHRWIPDPAVCDAAGIFLDLGSFGAEVEGASPSVRLPPRARGRSAPASACPADFGKPLCESRLGLVGGIETDADGTLGRQLLLAEVVGMGVGVVISLSAPAGAQLNGRRRGAVPAHELAGGTDRALCRV